MKKVYGRPTPSHADKSVTNGISQVVRNLSKELPKFDYMLIESETRADIVAHHAGIGAGNTDVAFYHGVYPTKELPPSETLTVVNQNVFSDCLVAHEIIAPSDWIAEALRRTLRVQPNIIHWGVNLDEWEHDYDHEGYILWNKNRDTDVCTTDWLDKLTASMPEQQFVSTYGFERQNTKIIGSTPFDQMCEIIKRAAIYLATTVETGDIGSREALASGIPVLGFNQGAVTDFVIHGYNGFLAEPGDLEGLILGAHWIMRNRKKLSVNAIESSRGFGWEHVAEKVAAVFDKALVKKAQKSDIDVSVVVPCYNYEDYVVDAIMSAANQITNFNVEIIAVNDGSTDNTGDILDSMQLPNFKVIHQENMGVAHARNNGIKAAKGQYIVCLDADDMIQHDFVEVCASYLDNNKTSGLTYTRLSQMETGKLSTWLKGSFDYKNQTSGQNQVPTCCMFRKVAWERVGGYKQRYFPVEDGELWTQISTYGWKVEKCSDRGLFLYRMHNTSATADIRAGRRPLPKYEIGKGWIDSDEIPSFANAKVRGVRNYVKPKVSIVIPVGKGHEESCKLALDSIEAQSFVDWEILVVNDTGTKLEYGHHPYAKIIDVPKKKVRNRPARARNVGLEKARGDFVVFLDADDYLLKDFLQITYREFRIHGKYIYTDWYGHHSTEEPKLSEAMDFDVSLPFTKGSFHPITTLLPTQWAREVGGFDESMVSWEDWDFYAKLVASGYCGFRIKKPLIGYNYSSGTMRNIALDNESELKKLLKDRYYKFIVDGERPVCKCLQKRGIEFDAQDKAVVEVIFYNKGRNGLPITGKQSVKGSISQHPYGRWADGDALFVYADDQEAEPERFVLVEEHILEIQKTKIPSDL